MLPILILTDKSAHVLTASAISPVVDLFVNKGFEGVRKANIHRNHDLSLDSLAKFGKNFTWLYGELNTAIVDDR